MTLPNPRYVWYSDPDIDVIQFKITKYLGTVIDKLGYDAVSVSSKLLAEMGTLGTNIASFGFLFDMVLAIFVCISTLLIHSLIMIKVETKTFEIGIMRMVGVDKFDLVVMIFVQTCMFALPAIILGFLLSFPAIGSLYMFVFKEKL